MHINLISLINELRKKNIAIKPLPQKMKGTDVEIRWFIIYMVRRN
jgi:hypothetical protein